MKLTNIKMQEKEKLSFGKKLAGTNLLRKIFLQTSEYPFSAHKLQTGKVLFKWNLCQQPEMEKGINQNGLVDQKNDQTCENVKISKEL